MSSRSERHLAKAEKCQQVSDAADTSGTKRLYETDKKPLLEKNPPSSGTSGDR